MSKLLGALLIGAVIVGIWKHVTTEPQPVPAPWDDSAERTVATASAPEPQFAVERADFRCDGRVYCSQMTSCAEAEYFLEHCPGVKMDDGGDGVPCERQWCGDR